MRTEHRLLGVGVATLDIINQVARYPHEDDEVRATGQRIARGGNAANTLSVLRQFGHQCDWVGCHADDRQADLILADLKQRGIGTDAAVRCQDSATPTSYITLSDANASRTIVHYRRLRELTAADFAALPLDSYHWVHFEGRHPVETALMIERVRRERPHLPISVEIEKNRPELARLWQPVSLLLFSRAFVEPVLDGPVTPWDYLAEQQHHSGAALCVAPWGAEGAYGIDRAGQRLFAPAETPGRLTDTLAAGDVFNAVLIDALLRGLPLGQAMACASRVAGYKCGYRGIDGLIGAAREAGIL
ncbi:Fructosamine kinase FrlD [Thiorhodovibrio winogradskyi]|uniref:Fructosamine kinase FrlD n=1 Tax=Thiorhodovibrio winogradskyi TaxID=77007 RepID=A0ABZ0S775_9GAMM|nr:PfkB family carbohydrate kinase [Thiorhodovibrio winogradskyi]